MLSRTMVFSLVALSSLSGWVAACGGTDATTGTTTGEGGAGTTSAAVTGTGGATTSASTSTTTSASTSTTTSASTSTTSSGGSTPRYCAKACQTAADCTLDDGAYSADNFSCTGGACEFLGCKTDAECVITQNNPAYGCGQDTFLSARYCAKKCQTAADCKVDDGAYSTDNFTCSMGKCSYVGCKTDAECAITQNNPAYGCGQDPAFTVPYCAKKCQNTADCKLDDGAYGADNFSCTAGKCQYVGCTTDAECKTTQNNPAYVCGG